MCSWNHQCLRFLAKPAPEGQVYAHFVPEVCDDFIKVFPKDDVRSKAEAVKAIQEKNVCGYKKCLADGRCYGHDEVSP
jgi:hypothetical protein